MRPSQRLARSAIDATRFTPTSPHAYSRSSAILHSTASHAESPSSSFQPNLPPRPSNPQPHQSPRPSSPPTETPAQKVARLRAEHLRNRQPKLTLWERIVIRGRVIADRAHFVTAVFLIGLTVVAGIVTVFSLADMILYNRRKRQAFFAEQNMMLQAKLAEAKETLATGGTVDEDQMLLLDREKIAQEAEAKRRERKGFWELVKQGFSSQGLKVEEDSDVRAGSIESVGQNGETFNLQTSEELPLVQQEQSSRRNSVLKSVEETRRAGEKGLERMGVRGGPLDQLADGDATITNPVAGETKSWLGWLTGR